MNDTFGAEFHVTLSTEGVAAAEAKDKGIAPVFIKQVLMAPEGPFQLFDIKFNMVCVKGILRNIETSSTKITYTLEDSTGRIEAHYWLEEGNSLKAPDVMLNKYARVYGSIRSQGDQKTLMVFKMYPIDDPNEVVTHILEVLNARYKSEEFSNECDKKKESNDLGLDGKNLAVFQAIKSHPSSNGINRDELKRKFNHMKEDELNEILEFMISEGHIYSSIDTNHFLTTE